MTRPLLVIQGHPNPNSYCEALADAYVTGAKAANAEIRYLKLHQLQFDPILHTSQGTMQPLEPDLLDAQESILRASHLVLVYPTWWGGAPALMKGFFERVLTQGYAFRINPDKLLWDKLLTGRTAHLITTMNTPPLFYRFVYGDSGIRVIKENTLGYCGIQTQRVTRIGMVRKFSPEKRQQWLGHLEKLGQGCL